MLASIRSKVHLKAEHVMFTGLLLMPSFLFQDHLGVKWGQVFFFVLLSALAGKRVKLLPNIIMISTIVLANLITPIGRVLYQLGSFPITAGALGNGLERAALLIGMIYISRFAVRRGLRIPGKTGHMLSLVFFYFEKILEGERISKGHLIKKIDDKILAVHQSSHQFDGDGGGMVRSNPLGYCYLASVLSANWLLFLLF